GIYLPLEQLVDTVILACQIDEHLHSYDLDYLAKRYVNEGKDKTVYEELASLFGGRATRNVQMPRISKAPSDIVAPYAKQDTRATLELFEWQLREIKRQGINDIVKFELSKMPTFVRTEMHGIRVDLDYAEQAQSKLTPIINRNQKALDKIAGKAINVDSSPQIKTMFDPVEVTPGVWETKDGVRVGTTPGGGPSINAEVLRYMDHPAAQLILDLRSLHKMRDTFLGKHVLEHQVNGRVYPNINQSKGEDGGTGTGRLSYTGPALQQIPSRNKELASIIKPCFLPDEGQVWVDTDKASFEVRVFLHHANNPDIIRMYKEHPETDGHQMVADLTGLVRNATYNGQPNAKQLNLSMIFNQGEGATAEKMGMEWYWDSFVPRGKDEKDRIHYKAPSPEAKAIIEQYHRSMPGVRELAREMKDLALRQGYIETDIGRRLRFPNGFKAYKASGLLIQATAADINKENWTIIEETLGDHGRLLLNTHDSYGMSIEPNWKPHFKRVKKAIERDRLRVPLILDWNGTGNNWHEALQGKDLT
ncbi:MAG: aminoadenine-incorporating DNA polymerase DpoZ, partial [Gammaproteobacteria bacterium]|nr:aminoadenine-incorporating DNA polymerase DpoZ [Gammaproteobacteria bacterium]